LDRRRVLVYLSFAFGISWAAALVIWLTGGIVGSLALIPGVPVTLALVLIATVYMFAPALAHVMTRLATREGWDGLYLRPRFGGGVWRYLLLAWAGTVLMTAAGAVAFFALFPGLFDPSMNVLREQLQAAGGEGGEPVPLGGGVLFALVAVQAVLFAPVINSLLAFGEEFGWRAYLQPKLMPLGPRRAMVVMGLVWGIWHWPLILMGHNYGLDYPGRPWLGLLAMVWFTFVAGTFFGWLAYRGGSVWPAVLGHATVNAVAGLGLLFAAAGTNPLLGPTPAGSVGGMGFVLAALLILLRWRHLGGEARKEGGPGREKGDPAPPRSATTRGRRDLLGRGR
jgi:membrane protease YdiL (CAAX protease family)